LLNSAKGCCHHGQWDAWLKRHFDGTSRHARRLMSLSREYPDPELVPAMSLSEALRALSGERRKCQPALPRVNERMSRIGAKTLLPRIEAIAQAAGEAVAVIRGEHLSKKSDLAKLAVRIRANASRLATMLAAMAGDDDGANTPSTPSIATDGLEPTPGEWPSFVRRQSPLNREHVVN
jgi:hypothetical protein